VRAKVLTTVFGLLVSATVVRGDDWPQWRGPQRDGVWRETGIVKTLPSGKLTYRWRTPVGSGFAGPAVAGQRVYVADRIVARDESLPRNDPGRRKLVRGGERILCLDAESGRILWKYEYACPYNISYPVGPRATPTVDGGKVYSLGAMGDLFCFDAESGKVVWQKNYPADFGTEINFWGMAAAPLIDGDHIVLLAGGKNNGCVVALNKLTGVEVWRALDSADPGYAAPILIDSGGRRQLIVWNPVGLYGLDPKTGAVYWQQKAEIHLGHSIATPIFDPNRRLLFVTSFFDGPMMLKLGAAQPTASLLWKGNSHSELPQNTDGLHSIISTPAFQDGYIYGICSYGQLRCLDATTGKRIWETFDATGRGRWWNAFLIQHEDHFLLCNEQGELIIAKLSPKGYHELSRSFLIEPTNRAQRRKVVWSHPAFAHRCIFARNDKEVVCVDLSAENLSHQLPEAVEP